MALNDAARQLVESGQLAHLVTTEPDGTLQVSCVWVGLDGAELVFASLGARRKLDNLRRDPRYALSIEAPESTETGLRHYLVVHGRARISEGGAPELLQRLAYTYIGPGVSFPPVSDPPPGYVVHLSVDRVGGVGPWDG